MRTAGSRAPERAVVLCEGAAPFAITRTERALARVGTAAILAADSAALGAALAGGARWIVRAGAFDLTAPPEVPPSATGRPVAAIGAPLRAPAPSLEAPPEVALAEEALRATGGDLSARAEAGEPVPFVSAVVDERLAERIARAAEEGAGAAASRGGDARAAEEGAGTAAITRALSASRARVVRLPALDAPIAAEVRVAEVVTSLQIGGAERVARDLARGLGHAGVSARLFALGRPARGRWAPLPHEVDLGRSGLGPRARMERLVGELDAWGADVVHAHLFGPDVLGALADMGYRPVVTIHNAEPGWPPGTAALDRNAATLVLACAQAVERALREAGVRAPVRTAFNGVEPTAGGRARGGGERLEQCSTPGTRAGAPSGGAGERLEQCSTQGPPTHGDARGAEAAALRRAWGAPEGAIVVLIVANPRPQKRLDRVPEIAARLAAASGRAVHVVWAGAAADTSEEARAIEAQLVQGLAERGVPCHALGAATELDAVRRACDVLLGTSAWEGLSLSHLEALDAGLPIVVTDAGGTREIAAEAPDHVTLLAPDAPAERFAAALAKVARAPRAEGHLPPAFEVGAMVRCHARLLRRAARRAGAGSAPAEARSGAVLVTNNFSPGGAQSSARRLLLELARRGHPASAITLQEHASNPTPGTAALRAGGVAVTTLPPGLDPAAAAERMAALVDEARAAGVLLWNVIAEHKVLLCDLLWDVPVFDVSPGEMYFRSLARYFERPRPDCAIRTAHDHGGRLAGAVVKFEAERAQAEAVLGCPVHVIPNGVPLRDRGARRRDGEPLRFGTAVRIHPDKRLELLLDAFERLCAEHPGVHLDVLGGPDAGCESYSDDLARRAAGLPVRWLGFSDEVGPFLDTLDAFVLVAEPAGCPNASLEALGAGLPVLATDVGGIREQLGDGAGLVVPRHDPAALAAAMADVAGRPELRAALARAGRARAAERFGLAVMADRYARLLGLTPPEGGEAAGGS